MVLEPRGCKHLAAANASATRQADLAAANRTFQTAFTFAHNDAGQSKPPNYMPRATLQPCARRGQLPGPFLISGVKRHTDGLGLFCQPTACFTLRTLEPGTPGFMLQPATTGIRIVPSSECEPLINMAVQV